MKKVFYTLVPVAGGYAFHPEKGKNSKTFTSKETGLEILGEIEGENFKDSPLTAKNAGELLTALSTTEGLKTFEDAAENSNALAVEEFNSELATKINHAEILTARDDAKETGNPRFVMCGCGKHGFILTKNKVVDDARSKSEARDLVEKLMQLGEFDDAGKTKLLAEIENSNLPEEEPAGGGTNLLSGMLIGIGPNGVSVAEISVVGFR